MTSIESHYARVLPSGQIEVWVGVDRSHPLFTSCEHTHVCTCEMCDVHSIWAPIEQTGQAEHASMLRAFPYVDGPCRCLVFHEVYEGDSRTIESPKDARVNDPGSKPFLTAFSWTIGLPWDPPGLTADLDGDVVNLFLDGKKIARYAKPDVAEALKAVRIAMY